MKLISFFLFVFFIQASASCNAQQITLVYKNAALEDVMTEIRKQSGYNFVFRVNAKDKAKPVTINIANKDIKEALDIIFKDQIITYSLNGKSIILSIKNDTNEKKQTQEQQPLIQQSTITGKITNKEGEPLEGATVKVKGTEKMTLSDAQGNFAIINMNESAIIEISFLGYEPLEILGKDYVLAILVENNSKLDEAIVIAYGTTTQRLNTGSVSRVTVKDISEQPASNLLEVLSGRIPGLTATQSSGVSGSSFNLQIRGRNSLTQASEPLILIDGIPFAPQNENINSILSAIGNRQDGGGLSPFFSINPSDIESIEVLKDADATAIYGSRGANGVILITTRKGLAGNTQITANFSQGISKAPKGMEMLNTQQYLTMRREAFENAGVTPDIINAPDLTEWDQYRYTDLHKELIGNTGQTTNGQLSISGGNQSVQFLLGGAYFRETNIFPGKLPNSRGNIHVNLNHNSNDELLHLQFIGGYSTTSNAAAGNDFSYFIDLPPNLSSFYNENGNLNWVDRVENPYSYLFNKYKATAGNLTGSFNVSYSILSTLSFKALFGYNELNSAETKFFPKTSRSPEDLQASTSQFGNRQYKSWNVEPQLEYNENLWVGRLNVLIGGTLQERIRKGSYLSLSGFSSDALLGSVQAASAIEAKSNTNTLYRYQALFGRINYNIMEKYLLNITGRRDGSSRFGPGRQYANFGAFGAAWIFSSESVIRERLPFLSYGKLRGSFGITGNDQIGDYQYLDAWETKSSADGIYQGATALFPANLYNPEYGWEENKKLEIALELGFWADRLIINADYFQNRSSNQLIRYRQPYTTGFGSILMNFPALIENKGWEILINGDWVKNQNFGWSSSFNITFPKNALLNFPDIEASSYASSYVIGKSLNSVYNYRSLGIDAETGLFYFVDLNGDGLLSVSDYFVNGNLDPNYYGGLHNNFRLKKLTLSVLLDYKKQMGRNYMYALYSTSRIPGTMYNQPVKVLDRWQQEGDITNTEKFSNIPNPNRANVLTSNVVYSDQSFIRLRSIHLSYSVGARLLSAIKVKNASVYVQGQNLFTWNKEKGYNPEVQHQYSLAPLKTYAMGIQLTF